MRHARRDEHAPVVVGAVGGLSEVEREGGAVGGRALAVVVQDDPDPSACYVPVVRRRRVVEAPRRHPPDGRPGCPGSSRDCSGTTHAGTSRRRCLARDARGVGDVHAVMTSDSATVAIRLLVGAEAPDEVVDRVVRVDGLAGVSQKPRSRRTRSPAPTKWLFTSVISSSPRRRCQRREHGEHRAVVEVDARDGVGARRVLASRRCCGCGCRRSRGHRGDAGARVADLGEQHPGPTSWCSKRSTDCAIDRSNTLSASTTTTLSPSAKRSARPRPRRSRRDALVGAQEPVEPPLVAVPKEAEELSACVPPTASPRSHRPARATRSGT